MAIALYETLYAFDATRMSSDGEAIRTGLRNLLEKYGAEILVERPWDENGKLAYPINKQKKAYFHILYYKMESTKQGELEADLRLNEDLLRHMTIHVDPKWADTVLEAARNDGNRFAIKGMQDDSAALGEGIISNDPLARGEVPDLAATGAPAPRPRQRRTGDEKPE